MTFTINTYDATSISYLEADYPILMTSSVLPSSTQLPRLDDDFTYGADIADSNYPTKWSHNNYTHSCCQPTADDTYCGYYSYLNTETVDTIFIAMADNITVDPSYVRILVSNNSSFTTPSIPLYDAFPNSHERMIYPFKSSGGTYTEVEDLIYWLYDQRYTTSVRHRFIEVWLGQRIQLTRKPLRPADLQKTRPMYKDFESNTGVATRYVMHNGRRMTTLRFKTGDATELAQYEQIWTDSSQGRDPIVFCEKPYTEPEKAGLFQIANKKYDQALKGPFERDILLELVEQGGSRI